jgi:hypothetical protein
MKIIVNQPQFNQQLVGKAIRIRGIDCKGNYWDGNFLVKRVKRESMEIVNYKGETLPFSINDILSFSDMKITVLKEDD